MEDLYTYLGYIVIAVLIYLIYITLFPSTTSEGFMGFGSDSDSDSKDKKNSSSKNSSNSKNSSSKNSSNSKKSTYDKRMMSGLQTIIDDLNTKSQQALAIYSLEKDRKQYEDLIIAVEDRINSITLSALPALALKISTKPDDPDIEKTIEKMNILNNFRATLTENMKYLDGLE
jgi:molecular chaperone GrpE (heat shock protein)